MKKNLHIYATPSGVLNVLTSEKKRLMEATSTTNWTYIGRYESRSPNEAIYDAFKNGELPENAKIAIGRSIESVAKWVAEADRQKEIRRAMRKGDIFEAKAEP